MGKIGFTPIQKKIFELFAKEDKLSKQFYFTGGTALSVFYFQHRFSEDLDFFSSENFEEIPVIEFMRKVSLSLHRNYRYTKRDPARIFEFAKGEKLLIKVDFVHYAFPRIEKGKELMGVSIDSLRDIGANKLLTINQRTDIKDFVDLYFLLKEFTVWDLIYACEKKFRMEIDIILLGLDFLKIDDFQTLPQMIVPLTLNQLKKFFRKMAKEIGRKVTT